MGNSETTDTIEVTIQFSGGLEIYFGNERYLELSLPRNVDDAGKRPSLGWLIRYLAEEKIESKKRNVFIMDETVRPGILVLINDVDWELEGGDAYELQPKDCILFVSTLHGG